MKGLSIYIKQINDLFWSRIVRATSQTVESMSVFRIFYGLFLLIAFEPNFGWLGNMPQYYFNPPIISLANLVDDFPDTSFFIAIDFILLASVIAIILGIRARIAGFVFVSLGILATNFQFSFGKIDHSILIYATLACFSFTEWGTRLAILPDKKWKHNWNQQAFSLLAIFVCFGFFVAGLEKGYWWSDFDFDKSGSVRWVYDAYYTVRRQFLLAPYVINVLPFWSYKFIDYLTVAFELSPLLFLLKSRLSWRIWLLAACCFHLVNTLVLNISFLGNAIVYLAFVNYSGIYGYVDKVIRRKTPLFFVIVGVIAIVSVKRVHQILTLISSQVVWISKDKILPFLYFSLVVWAIAVCVFIIDFKRELNSVKNIGKPVDSDPVVH